MEKTRGSLTAAVLTRTLAQIFFCDKIVNINFIMIKYILFITCIQTEVLNMSVVCQACK